MSTTSFVFLTQVRSFIVVIITFTIYRVNTIQYHAVQCSIGQVSLVQNIITLILLKTGSLYDAIPGI